MKPDVISITVDCKNPRHFLDLFSIHLGTDCDQYLRTLEKAVQEKVRKKCLEFYIVSCDEIRKRLPLDENFLEELIFIDPKIALSVSRPSKCAELTLTINRFSPVLNNCSMIVSEWRDLQMHFTSPIKEALCTLSIPEFWHKVSQEQDFKGDFLFKNISGLAQLVMSLPHSNAEAERVFSIMTDVKSKKRNRLEAETLNSLCVIRHNFKQKNVDASSMTIEKKHLSLMRSTHLYKNVT